MKEKRKRKREAAENRIDPAMRRHLEETTDPRQWEELAPFRETFLRYFMLPEQLTIFRQIGRLFYQVVLDAPSSWPASSAPFPQGELRALGSDLRYAESYLASVARTLVESDSPSAGDLRLARLLTRECLKVRKVALRMERVAAQDGASQG